MRSLVRLLLISATVVTLAGFMTLSAQADLMGDSVTFNFTNFPTSGSNSITVTLGGGAGTSGDVSAFMTRVATPGGGEWDYFYIYTNDGAPLAVNTSQIWQVNTQFTLNQPVIFDGIENQWTVNGTPVSASSLTPSGFINFAGYGPLGDGYVNGYGTTDTSFNPLAPFNDPLAAGAQDFPFYVSPYSYVNSGGNIPLTADGYNFAYHFDPVPLPPSVLLLGSGLLGMGLVGIRRKMGLTA